VSVHAAIRGIVLRIASSDHFRIRVCRNTARYRDELQGSAKTKRRRRHDDIVKLSRRGLFHFIRTRASKRLARNRGGMRIAVGMSHRDIFTVSLTSSDRSSFKSRYFPRKKMRTIFPIHARIPATKSQLVMQRETV